MELPKLPKLNKKQKPKRKPKQSARTLTLDNKSPNLSKFARTTAEIEKRETPITTIGNTIFDSIYVLGGSLQLGISNVLEAGATMARMATEEEEGDKGSIIKKIKSTTPKEFRGKGFLGGELSNKIDRFIEDQILKPTETKSEEWIDALNEEQKEIAAPIYDEKPGLSSWKEYLFLMSSGTVSIGEAIGITAITKNPTYASLFLSVVESSDVYNEAREAGKTPTEAKKISVRSGVGTFLLEKVGLDFFFKNIGGSILTKSLAKGGFEIAQEELQTFWQNFVAKKGYDKGRNITEGWFETIIATLPVAGFAGGAPVNVDFDVKRTIIDDIKKEGGLSEDEANNVFGEMLKSVKNSVLTINASIANKKPGLTIEDVNAELPFLEEYLSEKQDKKAKEPKPKQPQIVIPKEFQSKIKKAHDVKGGIQNTVKISKSKGEKLLSDAGFEQQPNKNYWKKGDVYTHFNNIDKTWHITYQAEQLKPIKEAEEAKTKAPIKEAEEAKTKAPKTLVGKLQSIEERVLVNKEKLEMLEEERDLLTSTMRDLPTIDIISGKPRMKPGDTKTEWKEMLGKRYYRIFRNDPFLLTPDEIMSYMKSDLEMAGTDTSLPTEFLDTESDFMQQVRKDLATWDNYQNRLKNIRRDIKDISATLKKTNPLTKRRETTFLKTRIRAIARGVRMEHKETLKELRAKLKAEEKLGEQARKEELKRLKQRIKDRERFVKQGQREGRVETKREIKRTQEEIIRLMDLAHLKGEDRAKLEKTIKNIQTEEQLERKIGGIKNKIEEILERRLKKTFKNEILKIQKRAINSPSVAVDYKNRIKDRISGFEFKKGKTEYDRLNKTREYIQKQQEQGKDVLVPKKVFNTAINLGRKGIDNMNSEEMYKVLTDLQLLEKVGRLKYKLIKNQYEKEKQVLADEVFQNTESIDTNPEIKPNPGEELTFTDNLRNKLNKAMDTAQKIDTAISPMDVIFDILDGGKGKYDGANFRNFKARIDNSWGRYLVRKDELQDRVIEIAQKHKFSNAQLEKIGFYAAKNQEGGYEKLKALGYNDEQILGVELTAEEKELYDSMREALDKLLPDVKKVLKEVYNEDIKEIKNYFSYLTDWDAMSESEIFLRVGDKVEEFGQPTKNTDRGFAKKRVDKVGKQKIKLNALEIFSQHTDNASYMLELGKDIKMLSEIARSDEYGEVAGDRGKYLVMEWLDLMARKGGKAGDAQIKSVDFLRRNFSIAVLGFKLSSAMIQPTALLDGASYIGHWAFTGVEKIATSKEMRLLMKQLPEIDKRVVDDPAYEEFEKGKGGLAKARRAGIAGLSTLDSITASSVAAGAYLKKLAETETDIDYNKLDEDAAEYAQKVVRRTQASSFFKDAPLAITRGELTGSRSIDKALFQFQNFLLNRWSIIRHDILKAGLSGNKASATSKMLWLLSASAAAAGLRMLGKSILNFITGNEDDEDNNFWTNAVYELAGTVPFVGQALSMVLYGGTPVPALESPKSIASGIKSITSGQSPATRWKGTVRLAEGLSSIIGIPGALQSRQIINDLIKNKKSKGRISASDRRFPETSGLPKLPKLPKLPELPKL